MTEGVIEPTKRTQVSEIRLRNARSADDLNAMVGKPPTDDDYSMVLTGRVRVLKPDRTDLCVYLPGELTDLMCDAYDVLHMLKDERTDNRGDASGTVRMKRGDQKRTRSSLVASALLGSVDPSGIYPYCRLTSWTGQHLAEWLTLSPLLRAINSSLREHVPDRWARQRDAINDVPEEWRCGGTVFTTITVNNTYSTGVHRDAGDYEPGFSTLAVWSEGIYGGALVFPKWRVGVPMRTGDLLLMDAHELHGNTMMFNEAGAEVKGYAPGAERISIVAYMRTKLTECGTYHEELAKARAYADRRTGVTPAS